MQTKKNSRGETRSAEMRRIAAEVAATNEESDRTGLTYHEARARLMAEGRMPGATRPILD